MDKLFDDQLNNMNLGIPVLEIYCPQETENEIKVVIKTSPEIRPIHMQAILKTLIENAGLREFIFKAYGIVDLNIN